MNESEIQAWRDIIMTNTLTTMALVKLMTQKGLCTEAEIMKLVEETKKELGPKK